MDQPNGAEKKILVTGGLGFLGSHLCERLLEQGHQLTLVDSCLSNVVEPGFFRSCCQVFVEKVQNFVPSEHFDAIYHCASIVGPAFVLPYGGALGLDILLGTKKVIDLSLAMKSKLLFLSTSEVYGNDGIFHEDAAKTVTSNISVRLEYSVGKLLGEIMVLNCVRSSSLIANVVRPFNIVGPRQSSKGGFVVPRFVEAALNGEDITVFGEGQQVRAFTHVLDMVDALILVMESDCRGEIFNVGNPLNVMEINQLAQLTKTLTHSQSRIIHVDPKTIYGPLYEMTCDKIPDSSKIQRMLGWRPQYNIEQTLSETIDYPRAELSQRLSDAIPTPTKMNT